MGATTGEGTVDPDRTVADATPAPLSAPVIGGRFGRYRIKGLLGRGGMGSVYLAKDESSDDDVALKILDRAIASDQTREQFLREGRIAASIRHPRSVLVYSAEEIEGRAAIAMELVSGGTLADTVKSRGALPSDEVVSILLDLIEGLEAAQSAGILHRDIKPSNCFVESSGRVKIGDFGIAHSPGALSASSGTSGTPAYAAPEQLRGATLDVRADIYALGATAYSLLTGHPPFRKPTLRDLLEAVQTERVTWSNEEVKRIPEDIRTTVETCLAKQPAARFPDYRCLRLGLDPDADHLIEPAPKWLRPVAGMIDGWILMLLSIIAGLVGALVSSVLIAFLIPSASGAESLAAAVLTGVLVLVAIFYYAFFEKRFGGSPGKLLFGLRVRALTRGLTWRQAMLRAAIFVGLKELAPLVALNLLPPIEDPQHGGFLTNLLGVILLVLLFCRKSSASGGSLEGWHDVFSGTRVVRRRAKPPGPSINALNSSHTKLPPPLPIPISLLAPLQTTGYNPTPPIASYLAVGPFGWRVGFDSTLKRQVWIRTTRAADTRFPMSRRHANRLTRPRWIGFTESSGCRDDFFEAIPGRPLTDLLESSLPWPKTLQWLTDLASELAESEAEGSLPAGLSLGQIWISASGTAVLLDEPWDPSRPEQNVAASVSFQDGREFLIAFIEEQRVRDTDRRRREGSLSHGAPWPLHSVEIENNLKTGIPWPEFIRNLGRLLVEKSSLTRSNKAFAMLASGAIPTTFSGICLVSFSGHDPIAGDWVLWFFSCFLFIWLIPASIVALLLKKPGIALGGRAVGVVSFDGRPATRVQLFKRMLIGWTPWIILSTVATYCLAKEVPPEKANPYVIGLWLFQVVSAIFSASLPRSIQDRVAGTWLVPK